MQASYRYNGREAEEALLRIPRFTEKNDPERVRAFWEKLGCPGGSRKILHVAGTNGKGSVCSYLRFLLREMGKTTGLFTSPHLVRMTERICTDGVPVSGERFARGYETIRRAAERFGYQPTFFEFLFFIAMVLWEEEDAEYLILETGLGGRLDATNCIPSPALTVLTRIGLDHQAYLGDTIRQIAGEKAGILKPGVPVVFLDDPAEAADVIRERAAQVGAPCLPVPPPAPDDFSFQKKYIDFSYHSRYYGGIGVRLSTCAVYQVENATLALRAAELLFGADLTKEKITSAMKSAFWAGRMEEVRPGLYVDGAHNEDGIRVFLETVRRMRGLEPETSCCLLFSAVRDKAYEAMLRQIARSGLFQEVALTPVSDGRTLTREQLAEAARACGLSCRCFASAEEALEHLTAEGEKDRTVFAAGSLYLAGQVKAWVGSEGETAKQ